MSELHHILTLPYRPLTNSGYVEEVERFLKAGVPATYTLEQVAAFEKGEETNEEDSNTTPLHILCRSLPDYKGENSLTEKEEDVVLSLMDVLFEYGAGWNFLDYEKKHVGDLLQDHKYPRDHRFYERIVGAGVGAELLLRKIQGGEIEFLSDDELVQEAHQEEQQLSQQIDRDATAADQDATAADQETYLKTKLEYTDDALVTKQNRDGVMMDWETDIMEMAAKSLVSSVQENESCVLNIGFGMGIIDNFIQSESVSKHYICEAHPDVLAKMKQLGWYKKSNVVILEGRWQDTLNSLLDSGDIFFDGIYYDTFSEHYQDMLDLYDVIVGLLKPTGTFSFFNGLGADRPICYDVYRKIVELDTSNYGLSCSYKKITLKSLPNWTDVKRSYFNCPYYYHPEIRFA